MSDRDIKIVVDMLPFFIQQVSFQPAQLISEQKKCLCVCECERERETVIEKQGMRRERGGERTTVSLAFLMKCWAVKTQRPFYLRFRLNYGKTQKVYLICTIFILPPAFVHTHLFAQEFRLRCAEQRH